MSVFRNDILKRRDLDDRRRFFCLDQGREKKKTAIFARLEPFTPLSRRLLFDSFEI